MGFDSSKQNSCNIIVPLSKVRNNCCIHSKLVFVYVIVTFRVTFAQSI